MQLYITNILSLCVKQLFCKPVRKVQKEKLCFWAHLVTRADPIATSTAFNYSRRHQQSCPPKVAPTPTVSAQVQESPQSPKVRDPSCNCCEAYFKEVNLVDSLHNRFGYNRNTTHSGKSLFQTSVDCLCCCFSGWNGQDTLLWQAWIF